LYYGPRGRGKTMLMARVAAELRSNPEFSNHWVPIQLQEESYYEISSIGELWLEVIVELTRDLPDKFKANAVLSLSYLKENWAHPNLEHMAKTAVIKVLESMDKKAVIMIENLHQLLNETNEDFGWEIRKTMQNEPRLK
jgi:Cdc6-like AAA superfamily ATPase